MKEIFLNTFTYVGGVTILIYRSILALSKIPRSIRLIVEQMMIMGVSSLPLVLITSMFTGLVTAVQAAYQTAGYVPQVYIGAGVGKAVLIELGPVLTALVVAGRVGSSIAAELGTMKVTEQIDALETLALDPVRYLVMPRLVSGLIMLPVLVIFSDTMAILGGLLVSFLGLGIPAHIYITGLKLYFLPHDLFGGLIKAIFFGIIIAIMGCYHGFTTTGGAEGVGRSTTRAVVSSCLLILFFNYVIATLVFG